MSEIRTDTINNASGDNDSGIDLSTNDQVKIKTANTTALTVDASQKVGIGTSSPTGKVHSVTSGNVPSYLAEGGLLDFASPDGENMQIGHYNSGTNTVTERARISSVGDFQLNGGTTQYPGSGNTANGTMSESNQRTFFVSRSDGTPFNVNRNNQDGTIISIRQAGNEEGTISTSGSTTSYNAFSASHWSRLTDNSKPIILRGTVIETIDEMMDWYQAEFTVAETDDVAEYVQKESIALPNGKNVGDTTSVTFNGITYDDAVIIQEDDNKHTKCKISDTADSTRVYGVFANWDNDDDSVNDMYVTAVGTHVVRVHSSATVSAGDLLVSNGDGTAKVQDDDIIRSKTIGKVLTNIKQETYSDGSYTVPCALYCG